MCCLNLSMNKVFYTNIVTAVLEPLEGLVTLNVLLKALAMSWKAEGDEEEVWLWVCSPSWHESVRGLSASVSACT